MRRWQASVWTSAAFAAALNLAAPAAGQSGFDGGINDEFGDGLDQSFRLDSSSAMDGVMVPEIEFDIDIDIDIDNVIELSPANDLFFGDFSQGNVRRLSTLRELSYGRDLTQSDALDALAGYGAIIAVSDPATILEQGDLATRDDPGARVSPLPFGANPLFEPEVWKGLQDILPYIMPVGPDGNGPVIPLDLNGGQTVNVSPGGAAVDIGDPTLLDWNGDQPNVAACSLPPSTDSFALGLGVNAARLSTVFLSSAIRLGLEGDGTGTAYRYLSCSKDAGARPPGHCSGLLDADGRTIWTAHHCVASGSLGLIEDSLRDIAVGETRPCSAATGLRAVSFLGLTSEDFRIPAGTVKGCESITRVGLDLVRVVLSEPLPVPLADRFPVGRWRHLLPGELEQILVAGRRLYGLGYLQSAELYDLMGGRLFTVEYCAQTLAELLPKYAGTPAPRDLEVAGAQLAAEAGAGAIQHAGFACLSTDTLNGASGGPVFAVDDSGAELILIGVISGAAWVDFDMECQLTTPTPLSDACDVLPDGKLNVLALLP